MLELNFNFRMQGWDRCYVEGQLQLRTAGSTDILLELNFNFRLPHWIWLSQILKSQTRQGKFSSSLCSTIFPLKPPWFSRKYFTRWGPGSDISVVKFHSPSRHWLLTHPVYTKFCLALSDILASCRDLIEFNSSPSPDFIFSPDFSGIFAKVRVDCTPRQLGCIMICIQNVTSWAPSGAKFSANQGWSFTIYN